MHCSALEYRARPSISDLISPRTQGYMMANHYLQNKDWAVPRLQTNSVMLRARNDWGLADRMSAQPGRVFDRVILDPHIPAPVRFGDLVCVLAFSVTTPYIHRKSNESRNGSDFDNYLVWTGILASPGQSKVWYHSYRWRYRRRFLNVRNVILILISIPLDRAPLYNRPNGATAICCRNDLRLSRCLAFAIYFLVILRLNITNLCTVRYVLRETPKCPTWMLSSSSTLYTSLRLRFWRELFILCYSLRASLPSKNPLHTFFFFYGPGAVCCSSSRIFNMGS